MPRRSLYSLQWSIERQIYEVYVDGNPITPALLPESPDWYTYFAGISSFAFISKVGQHCTVRREKVQRGGPYWYAYRHLHGQTKKRYIGKTPELTILQLEKIAEALANEETVYPSHSLSQNSAIVRHSLTEQGSFTKQHSPSLQENNLRLPQLQPHYFTEHESLTEQQSVSLLESKFRLPHLQPQLIERPHLLELLNAGLAYKVLLLQAPAGSGKTTLISQWLDSRPQHISSVVWLSLDSSDNDPGLFWRYVITSCQRLQPDFQSTALSLLQTTNPGDLSLLTTARTKLLNELAQFKESSLLVLDDYHFINEPIIHNSLASFIEQLPSSIHIMLLSRSEPPFPLVRWRAKGELYDLSNHDLRFSFQETITFLQQALTYTVSDATIWRLDQYMEGWIAGLRLLILMLRAKSKVEAEQILQDLYKIQGPIQDYLISEILHAQPIDIQQFLLQTSIFSRLNGHLCDELIGRDDSVQLLEKIAHGGLFLEKLEDEKDSEQHWYRYYTPFAAAIRSEARHRLGIAKVQEWANKASQWFEQDQQVDEAIEMAIRGQNIERAVALIEPWLDITHALTETHSIEQKRSAIYRAHSWLERLPEGILKTRPILSFGYACVLLYASVVGGIPFTAVTKTHIEQCLDMAQEVWQRQQDKLHIGYVLAFRALLFRHYGAMDEAMQFAKQSLEYMAEHNTAWRFTSLGVIGAGVLLTGQIDLAREIFQPRYIPEMPQERSLMRPAVLLYCRACVEQLDFRHAEVNLRHMLVEAREDKDTDDIADAQLELGRISYAQNKLDVASEQVEEALAAGQQLQLDETIIEASLLLLCIQYRSGKKVDIITQTANLLARLQPAKIPLHGLLWRKILATQARLQLFEGDLVAVDHWLQARGQYNIETIPKLQQEQEEMIIARLLLAQGKNEEAIDLLMPLRKDASSAGRARSSLEMQLIIAQAYYALRKTAEARKMVQEVLIRVYPENYQRLFLDEGEKMALLLQTILPTIQEKPLSEYVRALLLTFARERSLIEDNALPSLLLEPLSTQEQRVLRLLMAGHSNPQIASELIVSVNTVKTQIQNIYRKLNVNNRIEASEVARKLSL